MYMCSVHGGNNIFIILQGFTGDSLKLLGKWLARELGEGEGITTSTNTVVQKIGMLTDHVCVQTQQSISHMYNQHTHT